MFTIETMLNRFNTAPALFMPGICRSETTAPHETEMIEWHLGSTLGVDIGDSPMNNFRSFWFTGNESGANGVNNVLNILAGLIGNLRVLGFALALTFSVILIIRFFITPVPQRREFMKSRIITLYVLVILLGAALAIMDIFFDIAKSIGTNAVG